MVSDFNLPPIQYDVPDDARAMLLIVHGMGEHSARYRPVIDLLNANRLGCATFDQRGHGRRPTSERLRGDVESFDDFVADTAAVIEAVRSKYPGLPLFVWGHSMGAIITTLTAARVTANAPGKIRGVITSGAPVASFDVAPAFVVRLLTWISYVVPRLRLARPFEPERLSRDLTVGMRYGEDPLVPKAITLRLLTELANASALCLQAARKMRVPWLVLHGIDDVIAPAVGSQRLMDALGSADKQIRLWPGARHEVHNEIEPTRTEFLNCIVEWVRERA